MLNCGAPPEEPGDAPSWFFNAPEGQWFEVPASNNAADVGASQGTFQNFTGAGIDQVRKELVTTCAGGHLINWRNATYVLRLSQEVPEWVRLVDDTQVPDENPTGNNGDASYADGSPRAVHHYNAGPYPIGDTIWLPAMPAQYHSGPSGSQVWGLDRSVLNNPPLSAANAPWTFYGRGIPSGTSGVTIEQASSAYDADTGLIWVSTNWSTGPYPFWSIDTADGSITRYPSWGGGQYPAPNTRGIDGLSFIYNGHWIIISPAASTPAAHVFPLSDPRSGTSRRINQSNSPNWTNLRKAGAVYHAPTQRAYFKNGSSGTTITTLDLPDDPLRGTYTWGTISAGGGSVPNGVGDFTHFNVVHDMGNGRAALIYAGNHNSAAHMFKLPIVAGGQIGEQS
ncbi:MAG: hypothetical protein AAF417_03640 [Pseudomonadota bacterium]